MNKEKTEYLRSFHGKIGSLTNGLYFLFGPPETTVKFWDEPSDPLELGFSRIGGFEFTICEIESLLKKSAEIIKTGIKNHDCKIAKDAKITVATLCHINSLALNELDEIKKGHPERYKDRIDVLDYSLEQLGYKYDLIRDFLKDLMTIKTRLLLEIQSTKIRKLKKDEAELIVKRILDDYQNKNWTAVAMQKHLAELNLQYSNVSIGKLDSWNKWLQNNPEVKPDSMRLTDGLLKNIDSKGKTHFSRKKEAERYAEE